MMEKRVGLFVLSFFLIIFGVTLLNPIASNIESTGVTEELNFNRFSPTTVNTSIELPGSGIIFSEMITLFCAACGLGHIFSDNEFILGSRQPPITGCCVTNTFQLTDLGANFTNESIEFTFTAEVDGFDPSTASRSILALTIIFASIAIALVALFPRSE